MIKMDELKILDLYEKMNNKKKEEFSKNVESSMRVKVDYEKTIMDTKWIEIIEDTVPYIDNIFRSPNRFIVNEEEIVKIELARKITVDSIKHLSKHTNLIQDINKQTGDVRPSKILNINKEESYDTYENRLIYTLVQNTKAFINQKKKILEEAKSLEYKDEKSLEYTGKSKIENQNVEMNFIIKTKEDDDKIQNSENGIWARIEKVEQKIRDLTSSDVYKILEKKHISLVRPPIKKTNVVLKNVNFQYAVKLWNYLQENLDDNTENVKDTKDYMDSGELKSFADENFLLNYVLINSLNKDEENQEEKIELAKNNLLDNMLEKLMDLDNNLTEEEIRNMIGKKFNLIKYKKMASMQEIQDIFAKHIENYLEKINRS